MWKFYILTIFYLLKVQNGTYQYDQLTSYVIDTYPVYVIVISS